MEPALVAGQSVGKNPGPAFVLHRNSDNFRNTVRSKRRVRNFWAPKWKFSCNGLLIFFRISEDDCGTFSTEICRNCLLHCAGILTDTVFEKKIFTDFRRPTVCAANCTDFPRLRRYMERALVAGQSVGKNPGPTFVLYRNSDNFRNTVRSKRRVRNFWAPKWKFSCNGF